MAWHDCGLETISRDFPVYTGQCFHADTKIIPEKVTVAPSVNIIILIFVEFAIRKLI
jgi:hypothetical protein